MTAAAAVRARAVAVPTWVWLAGIVLVSVAIRIALARRMVAPWIMIDEIVYSELAKSFAGHGSFLVRGEPSHGYGFVYPVLIAPAWRVFGSIPDAYAAAKAINGVVMSLAAVPAYLLARRLLPPRLALVAAALSVAVPSMLYTGTLMTENVFYPLFLIVVLALVMTLERPTPVRQALLLVLCGLAFLARAQAVALVAAAATAPVLLALFERRAGALRRFVTLYALLAGGAVLALLATVARGRSVYSLLGAYRAATDEEYSLRSVLDYVLWHVGELDLYLGIVPFAALLAIWLAPRGARPFAAASLAVVGWLVLEVAAFASQQSERIEERNMFYVAPLALIALVALAADGVVTRRRRVLAGAAVAAAVLPAFVPYTRFITTSAVSDTFGLLPWWWLQDHGIQLDDVRWAVLAASAVAAALLFVPRRFVLVLPALVGAYFVATAFVVENGRHGIHLASVGSLWAGTHAVHPDWIDRAAGRDALVDYLWSGTAREYSIWENEFFSRSFRRVLALAGPGADPLPQVPVERRGHAVVADGRPVRSQYVLADGTSDVAGRLVARDPLGLRLYRVDGPIVLLSRVTGLYPNDTWSGAHVRYERIRCRGGRLTVTLGSDPALYARAQVVTARVAGAVVGRARVPPSGQVKLTVPLRPVGGRCAVDFTQPTKVPRGDPRALGAHYLGFAYRP
jgi:hypothetical protein